jgi:hypothetical protein
MHTSVSRAEGTSSNLIRQVQSIAPARIDVLLAQRANHLLSIEKIDHELKMLNELLQAVTKP